MHNKVAFSAVKDSPRCFNRISVRMLFSLSAHVKVFTPCLGVLHEMWGAWCMVSPWLIHDGLAHWRWLTHWLLDLIWMLD
jgi:hypothetical protein